MRWPFALIAICLLAFARPGAQAAELIMFETPICEWCEVWDEELGDVYAKTPEGRRAPLRRVDLFDPMPEDLKDIKGIRFTPTFVLMDKGREVGRILGYPGEGFFWDQLSNLLKRADAAYACKGERRTDERETRKC